MPSPQPLHMSITNGTSSSAPLQNGNVARSDASGGNSPVVTTNGLVDHVQSQIEPPKTSIEEHKQRAKAIMASEFSANPPALTASPDRASPPKSNDAQLNGGPVQSRKRSRSGTRISLPARTSAEPRTKEIADKIQLEQYVNRELMHTAAVISVDAGRSHTFDVKRKEREDFENLRKHAHRFPASVYGEGYAGYGHRTQDNPARRFQLVYPRDRKRPRGRRSRILQVARKDTATQAEQIDELVPVRLDIEWDKIRLRDTFTWNVHDRVVPVDLFAEQLVEDFKLPLHQHAALVQQVENSIREQIQEFHPHVYIDDPALDPHLPYSAYKNDEMRVLIKLNITIGQHTLVDQFEWEINNPMNSPEEFACQMTRDLSLSGEFTTAIAHSIREQAQLYTRSLYVTGHPFDGRPVEDHELLFSFLPSPITSPFRPYQAAKDFTPYLYELNELELEKTELSLSREERRQKRSVNRRGGPALPDLKERRHTIRTLLVSSVLPGGVDTMDESRIYKRLAASSGKSKRGIARDGIDDSDESDSDDSAADLSMPSHLSAGTARTRGMRGAASAAQAAMRSNLGRSATPESTILHHHETRVSGRRIVRDESSPEPQTSLIVKLRLPRQKFQQLLRDLRAKSKEANAAAAATAASQAESRATPTKLSVTPTPGAMGPPVSTPRMQQQSLPGQTNGASGAGTPTPTTASISSPASSAPPTSKHGATSSLGRVDATGPPSDEHPIVSRLS